MQPKLIKKTHKKQASWNIFKIMEILKTRKEKTDKEKRYEAKEYKH